MPSRARLRKVTDCWLSIGLGGGSLVQWDSERGRTTVGPSSVGYRIATEALVFGGSTVTATDIAVAAGSGSIGTHPDKASSLDPTLVKAAQARIKVMLEETLDAMKTSPEPIPAYLVGGGAFLAPDELQGISKVIKLPHAGVANAIGAAIAQVSLSFSHNASRAKADQEGTPTTGFGHRGCSERRFKYDHCRRAGAGGSSGYRGCHRSRSGSQDGHNYRQRKPSHRLHTGQMPLLREGCW